MEATMEFSRGLIMTLEMAKNVCDNFPDRKLEEDLVLGLAVNMTKDDSIGYNASSVKKCSNLMDEMLETKEFDTYDKGVIFACNMIIDGIEQTDGEPNLLKIYLEINSPDISPS